MEKEKLTVRLMKLLKPLIFIVIAASVVYWIKFKPATVKAYRVSRGDITETVMGTGTLDAKRKTIISAKISERIMKVFFDQGDRVKKGQLLVLLNEDELKMQVQVAEADLETARTNLTKLKNDLDYTSAVLHNAETVYQRQQKLLEGKVVSQSDYDKALEDLKVAKANNNRSKSALTEAESRIIAAERNVELRKTQLAYARIKAPFDGLIVFRARDPGDIVVPGTPILSVVSTKILWIESWVGETELEKVHAGEYADIIFRSVPERKFQGKVARIAKEVDKETREFIVDVAAEKLPQNWAIGQRAEVFIKTREKKNVLIIPDTFIVWWNNGSGVFIDKDGRAAWRPVKQGIHGDGTVEITEGLNEGDTVIIPLDRKLQLENNSRITYK